MSTTKWAGPCNKFQMGQPTSATKRGPPHILNYKIRDLGSPFSVSRYGQAAIWLGIWTGPFLVWDMEESLLRLGLRNSPLACGDVDLLLSI